MKSSASILRTAGWAITAALIKSRYKEAASEKESQNGLG